LGGFGHKKFELGACLCAASDVVIDLIRSSDGVFVSVIQQWAWLAMVYINTRFSAVSSSFFCFPASLLIDPKLAVQEEGSLPHHDSICRSIKSSARSSSKIMVPTYILTRNVIHVLNPVVTNPVPRPQTALLRISRHTS